ncbi:MAG TPA: D-cysteine desulfhydrase family protein [Thermomicrobiales bacterium]|jgi:D-cysteine desulfhydrase family pyridoxal phosphate-dependent enzyme|nr:D-cysteine desulfhydrase family protein [Thermomicrobiales bacterium]
MHLSRLARFPLISGPTPLQRATNLESAIGGRSPRIYIKRDDLTGLALGGNKVRKLEYLVADALAQRATVLVTEGAAQSNHARLTAAAANRAGLQSLLILDRRNGDDISGNLLLDHLLGAEIRIVDDQVSRTAAMATVVDELRDDGQHPYVIPTGGSVPIGAAGYTAFVLELLNQLQEVGESPRRLYLATGSQGTQAGIEVGVRAYSASFLVQGIAVSGTTQEQTRNIARLANQTAELLHTRMKFHHGEIMVDDGFIGPGYGKPTPEALDAIRVLARSEGILLDPAYTAKAMAGLIHHIETAELRPNDSVVFLHTGGAPALFSWNERLLEVPKSAIGDPQLLT